MKHLLLIFSLLIGSAAFAEDIANANQLIAKALGVQSAHVTLTGFAGPARRGLPAAHGETECSLRIYLDPDRAHIQLWSQERSGYSSESHLEYVHGEDEPDTFGAPRILENSEESLRIETDVTRPKRVFYPNGAEVTQALNIHKNLESKMLTVEISWKYRDGKPDENSRLVCRFPVVSEAK